jgi:hypothetical protein
MKDDEPTPEEQREAEALARALAGEAPSSAPPPEALETAALLRYASGEARLDPARREALAAQLQKELFERGTRKRPLWFWIAAPLGAGAAAAMVLAITTMNSVAPARRTELPALAKLPAPEQSLLAAQAEAARGRGQALGDLDAQMRAYRRALFDRLRRQQEGP